jgi:hypothetical protein
MIYIYFIDINFAYLITALFTNIGTSAMYNLYTSTYILGVSHPELLILNVCLVKKFSYLIFKIA